MLRRVFLILALATACGHAVVAANGSFTAFLAALWRDAASRGITRATFDAAFAGLAPDPGVLAAMRRQPEYGKPFGAYLAALVSPARVATARRKLQQWAATLDAIEQRFGVDKTILVSIWGIESSFGEAPDHRDVFRSLATLAQARFQHPFFRDELLNALTVLQEGNIPRREFVGSWAGAMGQAQFLPSSYLRYAVDFDGDGRPDIWRSVPDVLASIANYLQKFGWQPGISWGLEVFVPPGFDYRMSHGTFADWERRGLRPTAGFRFPASGTAILFFPSGAPGPAFLVTENFIVLKRFNNSDAYALAVAKLSDRLHGLLPIQGVWPANDFQPTREERVVLQRKLAALGYRIKDFTGHFDFELRDAVRELQQRYRMIPDGYPSRTFLDRVGVRAP